MKLERRTFIRVLTLAVCLSALIAAPISAQNQMLDFKLVNQTGVTINSIYIGPHDADEWGDDIMEDDVLRNGEDVDLEFHPKSKAAKWDLRIEDKDGNYVEWENLDLTVINVLTIKIVKGKAVAEWK